MMAIMMMTANDNNECDGAVYVDDVTDDDE